MSDSPSAAGDATHTTGPLEMRAYTPTGRFRQIGFHTAVTRPDGTPVALFGPEGDPTSEADARLFIAAPALLDACQKAFWLCDDLTSSSPAEPPTRGDLKALMDTLSAALNKADGY